MKKLLRIEADQLTVKNLKRKPYQMISIFGRLYRTDDELMIKDCLSSDCYIIYDINDTQPYLPAAKLIDPNLTRAFIDSAKMCGNKKKLWGNLDGGNLWKIFVAVAIVGSLIYGFLVGGHL